nr:hypothetical protein [Tanacetum cinerariifolium]
QSLDAEQVYLDSLLAQRVAEEHERESRASTAQPTQRQAKLDRISLNLTNKEWIGLVDQVQANLILSAELLGADVSKDTFSNVYNKIQRVVDLATAKDHHQQLKWSGETLEYSESKKLKSSHNTEQSAELPDTTFVSAGATISAGDPISAVPSISAASSIPVKTLITAVSPLLLVFLNQHLFLSLTCLITTFVSAGATISAGDPISAVPSISAASSIPVKTPIAAVSPLLLVFLNQHLFLSLTCLILLLRPLPYHWIRRQQNRPVCCSFFDEDDPEAEFKKYLRQVFDDDEPAETVSLSLVADIRTWEIIPTEFGLGKIHVITRADGTVKRFSTSRELPDQWVIRSWRFYALPTIHVLETKAGDIMYMFVDKKYPILPATIQRMLNHGLEIDRDPFANDLTTAI